MNKKGLLGGVGIVIVAAALIGPKFVGPQVEDTLKQHVEAINQSPAYKANVVSFESGWFSSTAIVELGMDFGAAFPDADKSDELSFEVEIDVQHGPILTRFSPGLGLASLEAQANDEALREFVEWEDENSFYNLTGSVGLFGSLSYRDSISPFTSKPNDAQIGVSSSGYQGNGKISSEAFSYEGMLAGAEILMKGQVISLGDMKLNTEAKGNMLSILKGELYEGEMSMTLEEIVSRQRNNVDLLNLKELDVEFISVFSDDEESMNIDMNYSVKSLNFDNMDLDNLILKMAFNNIDTEFLIAYNQAMKDIYGQAPDEIEATTQKLVDQNLPMLLQAEPELVISEFSGEMARGNFEGDLSTQLVGVTQAPDNLNDIQFWLSSLVVDASIAVDKPLLQWAAAQQVSEQQAPMMIDMYLQQGLLTETEDDYRSEFQMEDGEAMLNGQKIPLGNMM